MPQESNIIRIIHYNDVYNIDVAQREPVGGAARFVTAVNEAVASHRGETMVLFSGDAFSPAPLTTITEGAEMPPILNATKIDVACIGNHELDRGLDVLKQRLSETSFPWLVSNVFEKVPDVPDTAADLWKSPTAVPLGGIKPFHVLERAGYKFGFMGLASYDWLSTLDKIDPDDLIYVDFCKTAERLSLFLRQHHSCDFIIALTHMRVPDDFVLAENVSGVDLILGGHDHILSKRFVNGRWLVKSGTDFKNFSTIDLRVLSEGGLQVEEPVHHDVTSKYSEDATIAQFVKEQLAHLGDAHLQTMAITETQLDGRFVSIRTKETGLGNFICDAMTQHMRADIGMVNSGSFRSDSIEHEGEITRHTIDTILPFKDQVLVVAYTGLEVLQVLETSVSDYPHLVGKFCQVSGIKFSFDPRKPPGKRVIRGSVQCRNRDGAIQPLQETTVYKCAMKTFIFEGKDGYPQGDPSKVIQKAEKCVSDMIFEFLKGQHRENGELELLVPRIAPAAEGRIVCVHPNETLLHAYGDI